MAENRRSRPGSLLPSSDEGPFASRSSFWTNATSTRAKGGLMRASGRTWTAWFVWDDAKRCHVFRGKRPSGRSDQGGTQVPSGFWSGLVFDAEMPLRWMTKRCGSAGGGSVRGNGKRVMICSGTRLTVQVPRRDDNRPDSMNNSDR